MPQFQRFFASAFVALVLLFSLCAVQPARIAARSKCGMEIPDSLLTLYLKSDLIVVGAIENERFLKNIEEYDYGTSFETEKNLRVFDTLKGRDAERAAFNAFGFKPKNQEETDEISESDYPNIGDRALFFLEWDEEDDCYRLADGESGIKQLDATALSIYVKRIAELKRIAASRKNQMGKLTEWLVRLVEEPVTRQEGLIDLQSSFNVLEYGQEDEEENNKPVVLDESFRAENTGEIAKLLTGAQKQRLSGVLLASVYGDLSKLNDAESVEEIAPDYRLIYLTGKWDKTFSAMTAFALLQNAGDANRRKVGYLMEIITNALDDEELYEISSEYQSALAKDDNELTELSGEEAIKPEEISPESETPVAVENSADNNAVEPVTVETTVETETPKPAETIENPAAKITYKQHREELFAKFIRRYGAAISQSSVPE